MRGIVTAFLLGVSGLVSIEALEAQDVLYSTTGADYTGTTAGAATYGSYFQTTAGAVGENGSYYIKPTTTGGYSTFLYDVGASSAPSGTLSTGSYANSNESLFALSVGTTLTVSADFLASASATSQTDAFGITLVNPASSSSYESALTALYKNSSTGSDSTLELNDNTTANVLGASGGTIIGSATTTSFAPTINNTQWLQLQLSIDVTSTTTATVTENLYEISADGGTTGTLVGTETTSMTLGNSTASGSTTDLAGGTTTDVGLVLENYQASSSVSNEIDNIDISELPLQAVPEPGVSWLLGIGALVMVFAIRRKQDGFREFYRS